MNGRDDRTLVYDEPSPESEWVVDPWIGRVVAGRFDIEAFVAEGGVGRVYRGRQLGLDRTVAVKFLHPHLARNEAQKRRFHREARAASLLRHPSSVVILDFGEDKGQLYIAMEYLEGRSLADVLDTEFPIAPARIVDLLAPVCEVLAEAHAAGIQHRDIKPSNLIVVPAPDGHETVKIVDFGLARASLPDEHGLRLTPAEMVLGTPAYMSPEQCRGGAIDGRSDLYSLGVVLYEMLCDQVPFDAESDTDLMIRHLFADPLPPSFSRPDLAIPPRLESLAMRALAKRAADRFESALEMRDLLRAAVDPDADDDPDPTRRGQRLAEAASRTARADAFGVAGIEPATGLLDRVRGQGAPVVVVENPGFFIDSTTAQLRALGYPTAMLATPGEAVAFLAHKDAAAVVLDLRPDPAGLADWIAALASAREGVPVIALGPDDDLDLAARSLQAGVRDYVPTSLAARKLPRVLDRAQRAAHRDRARTERRDS